MQYKRLGKSGLKLSRLSLGSWLTFGYKVNERDTREMVSYAFDSGVNFIDTAECYANGEAQRLLGRVFRDLGVTRDSYCLSSKLFWGGDHPTQKGLSRKHINDGCNNSLARLKTDYIDILFCHRPDPDTSILETAWAMHDLITQGKVMYWGTSEWSSSQIQTAMQVTASNSLHPPIAEQPPYNLLCKDRYEFQTQPTAKRYGLGVLTTTPLSSGILSGKYFHSDAIGARLNVPENAWLRDRLIMYLSHEGNRQVTALQQLCAKHGATSAQLSLAWCLANPTITSVICGASNLDQLQENLAALDIFHQLDKTDIDELKRIGTPNVYAHVFDWIKFKSRPTRQSLKKILRMSSKQ